MENEIIELTAFDITIYSLFFIAVLIIICSVISLRNAHKTKKKFNKDFCKDKNKSFIQRNTK